MAEVTLENGAKLTVPDKPLGRSIASEPPIQIHKLNLELTEPEIILMREVLSQLGTNRKEAVYLQLKVANAILDATFGKNLI